MKNQINTTDIIDHLERWGLDNLQALTAVMELLKGLGYTITNSSMEQGVDS